MEIIMLRRTLLAKGRMNSSIGQPISFLQITHHLVISLWCCECSCVCPIRSRDTVCVSNQSCEQYHAHASHLSASRVTSRWRCHGGDKCLVRRSLDYADAGCRCLGRVMALLSATDAAVRVRAGLAKRATFAHRRANHEVFLGRSAVPRTGAGGDALMHMLWPGVCG